MISMRMSGLPVVTLNLKDYDSAAVADELMQRFDIAVRSGGHCAPLMHQALGTGKAGRRALQLFSL